jgi:hypothetical protein
MVTSPCINYIVGQFWQMFNSGSKIHLGNLFNISCHRGIMTVMLNELISWQNIPVPVPHDPGPLPPAFHAALCAGHEVGTEHMRSSEVGTDH